MLLASATAWSACVGSVNLFFPHPCGTIRSNMSVIQYLHLLALFWPGTFYLIRTRCLRNKLFFLATFPLHITSNVSPPWILEILHLNCVSEQLLKLGALRSGDASAEFEWAVINISGVKAPGACHGVFLCLYLRMFQCSLESLCV